MTEIQPVQANEDARLALVRDLVAALDMAGIAYCHWKSNENLRMSITGLADLDVLFDQERYEETLGILRATGFTEFAPVWYRRYPYIHDFIGIDVQTGKLVHVHAHFRLVLGEEGLKSYELPLAVQLLQRRVWDEASCIYRSDSCTEMLLLLVREAIKLDRKRKRRMAAGKDGGAARELEWLKSRVALDRLRGEAAALLGAEADAPVMILYERGLDVAALTTLRGIVERRLASGRRFSGMNLARERISRWFAATTARHAKRLGVRGVGLRRSVVGDGVVAAFIGPDGAGKSTVSATVAERLSRKVDVEHVYFGSGTGSAGDLRRAIQFLRLRKLGKPFRTLWSLALAREKRNRLRTVSGWRGQGLIVVCDRFPQADVEGYNDGPLLGWLHQSGFAPLRALARWERHCYERARVDAPDVVFRMRVEFDQLAGRRPEMNAEWLRTKREGINLVRFPERTRVVELDASQPLELVVRDAMVAIGDVLRNRTESRRAKSW